MRLEIWCNMKIMKNMNVSQPENCLQEATSMTCIPSRWSADGVHTC